ncbi:Guanine nucleotide-binding protein subunit gamma 3 [Sesamum angolense]|uniref:Guanine nucleotide-binding protein subunit gamma 3 n=1 Tax=Sesamum angolense TaxID=2727404 RepID=A0AAE1WP31_9LAMI|nr:Guanine nucleotide-binding protein subunit gamma 3 [Sesamum angolense]
MTGLRANGSAPSLPVPRPKSPPEYADLYGKRREMAKVQVLEREIGFLEACRFLDVQCRSSYTCVRNIADYSICYAMSTVIFLTSVFLSLKAEPRRFADHVASGNGSVEHPVSTFPRFAVAVASLILRGHAPVTALHAVAAARVGAARCLNATIASAATADALTSLRAAGIAVYPSVLPA